MSKSFDDTTQCVRLYVDHLPTPNHAIAEGAGAMDSQLGHGLTD